MASWTDAPPISEADFRSKIWPFTGRQEGGLSMDPHDSGNWSGGKVGLGELKGTNFGISSAAHPNVDVKSLTLDQAIDIYWKEYFTGIGADKLPIGLATVAFDGSVNCGPGRAKSWLPAALQEPDEKSAVHEYTAANLAFHQRLATWSRYGKVWGPRIAACETYALNLMAGGPAMLPPVLSATTPTPAAPKPASQPVLPTAAPVSIVFKMQWGIGSSATIDVRDLALFTIQPGGG